MTKGRMAQLNLAQDHPGTRSSSRPRDEEGQDEYDLWQEGQILTAMSKAVGLLSSTGAEVRDNPAAGSVSTPWNAACAT